MANQIFIELPIFAKDVFRLLALRTIVNQTNLIQRLDECFDFTGGIDTTERLSWDHDPFAYEHKQHEVPDKPLVKMTERELCSSGRAFFRKEPFKGIGRVIDYEIPLDNEKDSAYGKVDLLSRSEDGKNAFVLEVKKFGSGEHPLRALFEIFTFWKMLTKDGSHKLFIEKYKNGSETISTCERVIPGLLLDVNSDIFKNLMNPSDQYVRSLRDKFFDPKIGMRVFSYDSELNVKEEKVEIKN